MADIDYKMLGNIVWSDRVYRLRELPEYHGFPMIIRVRRSGRESEHTPRFTAGEMLRLDGFERQRRIIAVDSNNRHWSFPAHIGAKFDIKDKKGRRSSMYMSEMIGDKIPKNLKKFRFAEKDAQQLRINGEDQRTSTLPIIQGDFECKDVIRMGVFKANRITQEEADPRVLFLPAYMDMNVTVATMISGEPGAFWEEYMAAMTSNITAKVNLNMYRGKSDILIYDFPKKMRRPKSMSCLYEDLAPTMSVTMGGIMKKRPSNKKSDNKVETRQTRLPDQTKEDEENPLENLSKARQVEEEGLTEDELRVVSHHKLMLLMLEEEQKMGNDGIEKPWQPDEKRDADGQAEIVEDQAEYLEGEVEDEVDGCDDDEDSYNVNHSENGEERNYDEDVNDDGVVDDDDNDDEEDDINNEDNDHEDETKTDNVFEEVVDAPPDRGEGDGNVSDKSEELRAPVTGVFLLTSISTSSSSISGIDNTQAEEQVANVELETSKVIEEESKNDDASIAEASETKKTSNVAGESKPEEVSTTPDQDLPLEEKTKRPRSPGDGSPVLRRTNPETDFIFGDQTPSRRRVPPRVPPRVDSRLSFGSISSNSPVSPSPNYNVTDTNDWLSVQPGSASPTPQPLPREGLRTPSPTPKPTPRPRTFSGIMRPQAVRQTSMRFSCIQDFPADLHGLTIEDMCAALSFLNLSEYEGRVRAQSIDGEMAKELTEGMMSADLGMSGLAAKKWMKFIHHNWRPT